MSTEHDEQPTELTYQPLSDLYSLQTTQIKKITFPIFDKTKLPSSWSSQQRKVLVETALKELEVQQRLTVAIRCAKICLEASLLTQEQTEQKLRELWHLYQMYYETKSITNRFDRYLLDKHKPAIKALAILDPVRKSMTELITSPHLQDSLSHMTISTNSPDSGASSKTTDSLSPSPNEPEDSSTGNVPI
jgi:hypothetical protein